MSTETFKIISLAVVALLATVGTVVGCVTSRRNYRQKRRADSEPESAPEWFVTTHLRCVPPAAPTPTGIESIVCADIARRQQLGIAKYGRTVAESPDDMLKHAYEEALDLAVYLRAELERRAGK